MACQTDPSPWIIHGLTYLWTELSMWHKILIRSTSSHVICCHPCRNFKKIQLAITNRVYAESTKFHKFLIIRGRGPRRSLVPGPQVHCLYLPRNHSVHPTYIKSTFLSRICVKD